MLFQNSSSKLVSVVWVAFIVSCVATGDSSFLPVVDDSAANASFGLQVLHLLLVLALVLLALLLGLLLGPLHLDLCFPQLGQL